MTRPTTEDRWTLKLVEARLEEAADTLRRLPEQRIRGYVGSWTPVIREFCEAYGWHEVPMRLGPPQAAAIDRMDEALLWLSWLDRDDVRLVWSRACGVPWKLITGRLGVGRTTAWRRWVAALITISARLEGAKVPVHADHAA
jgi:hypothetical protein